MGKVSRGVTTHRNRNRRTKAAPVPSAAVLGRPSRPSSWKSSRTPSRKRPNPRATSGSSWPKRPDSPWGSSKSVLQFSNSPILQFSNSPVEISKFDSVKWRFHSPNHSIFSSNSNENDFIGLRIYIYIKVDPILDHLDLARTNNFSPEHEFEFKWKWFDRITRFKKIQLLIQWTKILTKFNYEITQLNISGPIDLARTNRFGPDW